MDRSVSTLLFLVLSAAVASAVTLNPQDYWEEALPNTPIPGSIWTLLRSDQLREVRDDPVKTGMRWWYHYAANETQVHDDPDGSLFFFEKDLHPGTKKELHFVRSAPPAPFIPRAVVDVIPFSSKKLPDVLARFSLEPNSREADDMRVSLGGCEHPSMKGEIRHCVTSLESMIDFTISNLGTRSVRAVSTAVGKERAQRRQYYTVASSGVETLAEGGRKVVICHVQPYPYAVFFCHATNSVTKAYVVPLVGEDGSKVAAVAVCHIDTSAWNPRHLAFQVLKVRPGTVPICHFLRQDVVVWTPSD